MQETILCENSERLAEEIVLINVKHNILKAKKRIICKKVLIVNKKIKNKKKNGFLKKGAFLLK